MALHPGTAARFEPTHWSLVIAAAGQPSADAAQALEALCRAYWFPLYAYARRRGLAPHDAQDLVQSFFADFLQRNWGEGLSQPKGRFRTFLLTALENFLKNQWHKSQAQKRGGGATPISFDPVTGEAFYGREPAVEASPAQIYDRAYAAALVSEVFEHLRADCQRAGKAALFEELRRHIIEGEEPVDSPAIAARLGMSEDAVRQARSRLRQRFRALLETAVAQTMSDPAQLYEEVRYLISVCAGEGGR